MTTTGHFLSFLAHFFLELEMFQTKVVEEIKTHIFYSISCYGKSSLFEIMWKKYCRAGQATNDNMAHAHCMLDVFGFKYTLKLFNAYCFSTTTMVARTLLSVTLYVQYIAPLVCIMSTYRYLNYTSCV
jgi:hypothetical protein